MADSRDRAPGSEEAGTAAHAHRATLHTAVAARDQAYRAFITHAQGCDDCITIGVDCQLAAQLKQIWRDARAEAAA